MKIGFTGTQQGMTLAQYRSFDWLMSFLAPFSTEFRHGDCIKADEDFHHWVQRNYTFCEGLPEIFIHPPENKSKRAFCGLIETNVTILDPKPYLVRNRDIVKSSTVLIATPNTKTEQLRSGTWATVREAKKRMIPIYIVDPDGGINKWTPKTLF